VLLFILTVNTCVNAVTPSSGKCKSNMAPKKNSYIYIYIFLFGHAVVKRRCRLFHFQVSRPHMIKHTHTLWLLWMNDQLVTEVTAYPTHSKHETNIHAHGGVRTPNPSNQAAADLHLRLHCCQDWQILIYFSVH
jgi:hypothetical protein